MRPQPIGLKGRPVASMEEAKATPIDFDGSVFYFPDLANRCIYTKQINMDGTAQFNMYELKEIPKPMPQPVIDPSAFVSRTEFEEFVEAINNMFASSSQATQGTKPKEEIRTF